MRYVARDGSAWKSYAEVAFANFLFARGVQYDKGKRYDSAYEELSGRNSGYYDFHFVGVSDQFAGMMLDVEIWGGTLAGGPARQEAYAETRRWKEQFNQNNSLFVGLEFKECYEEEVLEARLAPYLGKVTASVFIEAHDRLIASTKWAIMD